jgi:putative ABC transport system permease protein
MKLQIPDFKKEVRDRISVLGLDGPREAEIVEELSQHLEDRYRELRDGGASNRDALKGALADLDETEMLSRQLKLVEHKRWVEWSSLESGRHRILADLWSDIRYGLRLALRNPATSIIASLTLALGIGANTAIFSVVRAVLIEPLPFEDPESIVTVWENNNRDGIPRDDVSPANFLDWGERQQVFSAMAFSNPWSMVYTGGTEPETIQAALLSNGFFDILGVKPALGRGFVAEDYEPGHDNVVLLSSGLWHRQFGGDPGVVGRTLVLSGEPRTVIGILPAGIELRLHERERELFAPQIIDEGLRAQRRATYLKVIARLKPESSIDRARAAMETIASNLESEHPQTNAGVGVTIVPFSEHLVGRVRPALLLLFAAVSFVLGIACANLTNLLLARGAHRDRELAIRAALGASRSRLVRQLLAESFVLAVFGCALGLALASWGLDIVLKAGAAELPRIAGVGLDGRVLSFAIGLSLITAVASALAPAFHLSRPNLSSSLRDGRHGSEGLKGKRLRSSLVVVEAALAVVLMVGAGLLIRSFNALLAVDAGFSRDRLVVMQVFAWSSYRTATQRETYAREVLGRIRHLPGVTTAGVTTAVPFLESSNDSSFPVEAEGRPSPVPGGEPTAFYTIASPGYFSSMGLPLKRGRFFDEFDDSEARPVVIVTDAMARKFWPLEDPIGRKLRVHFGSQSRLGPPQAVFEVVGVVGSTIHDGLDEAPRTEFFRPFAQSPNGSMIFVVRTATDPSVLLPSLKETLWSVDRSMSLYAAATLDGLVGESLKERRFTLTLMSGFALLAVLLAATGVYGVLSFLAAQRTHEIGIRIALGARSAQIVRLIVGQGMRLAIVGLAVGLAGAVALTRLLGSMLFGVSSTDPVTYGSISLLVLAVALLASYVPARRAVRVDPLAAIRTE